MLAGCSVGLVHFSLDLAHLLCLLNTISLALLVPAPLVNLAFGEPSQLAELGEGLFGPVRVVFKLGI